MPVRTRTLMTRSYFAWGLLAFFVIVGLAIVTSITAYFCGMIGGTSASLIIGGLTAFATFTLAIATFRSVQLNRESVRELRKDREKPLYIDELRQVIQPSIERTKSNLQEIRSGRIGYRGDGEVRLRNAFPRGDVNTTTLQRVRDNRPELFEQYDEIWELKKQIAEQSEDVAETVQPQIENLLEDADRDFDKVIKTLLDETYYVGGNAAEFWDEYGDELEEIMEEEGGEPWEELKHSKEEFQELNEDLRDELIELKSEIQHRYGISDDEFTS